MSDDADRLPQFVIAGAPKAGTTALHAALATHPGLYLSPVKEPKYYLTGGRPPPRSRQRGPGDAHSAREWVWRRADYLRLFDGAPPGTVRGESTPFYLHDRAAQRRLVADVPGVRVIAVVRDPVDRAWSNWVHLRADGLEPEADFARAVEREESRVAAGWAPFWHYRGLGRYGEQLRDLYALLPRSQVLLLRYRQLVDTPRETLDRVSDFLGVEPGVAHTVAPENVKPFVADTPRYRALARVTRAGAALGAYAPPRVWRQVSRPLLAALHAGRVPRPPVPVDVRRAVLAPLLPDVALLEELTGESFDDWRRDTGRGDFRSRRPTSA
ncbi:Sulfotransferase family protein [Geodermatophilus dictyosporus]|uniref:Sulfotransferase family protein n=1 Tax=Geodermatophilus dictyosporus TaxID=1523247 RepID=A0A1I5JDM8_9ACTN|nr:sulfotransferase [Geodermatophilus dictyosporus]SFO70770.1 Sulfotransferase family protein [Geodermatophilus dictyosporus]